MSPCVTLATHQILCLGVRGRQELLCLGEKGRCQAPSPIMAASESWMSVKLLVPLPSQLLPVCLHGNQAKRLICQGPGSAAYLGAGF